MADKKYIEPKQGELKANDAVKFFDDVTDDNGVKLTKSEKRTRVLELMKKLHQNKDDNYCILEDGKVVPIIVERRHYRKPPTCYFNTADAPIEEIFKAFALKHNITYIKERPEAKKQGELIAQEVMHLYTDISVDNKKITGKAKRAAMILLFQKLYKDKEKNICILSNGEEIPIIVKRTGENERIAYYLNASEHRREVLLAFASATNCTYLDFKENMTKPQDKKKGELTARDCAKVFHLVGDCPNAEYKRENKEKILKWFHYIYENPSLNKVTLLDGCEIELVVRRMSYSQDCLCLNTSDASIKPFILKRIAEISDSTICLDNLDLSQDDKKQLHMSLRLLAISADKSKNLKDARYYHSYAQKAFLAAKIKTNCCTVVEYLQSFANKKGSK